MCAPRTDVERPFCALLQSTCTATPLHPPSRPLATLAALLLEETVRMARRSAIAFAQQLLCPIQQVCQSKISCWLGHRSVLSFRAAEQCNIVV